jgi:hypothetical protein
VREKRSEEEFDAIGEILKQFMNELYFQFQDTFEKETEFTGNELITAVKKLLKQKTIDILEKLQGFWKLKRSGGSQDKNQEKQFFILNQKDPGNPAKIPKTARE